MCRGLTLHRLLWPSRSDCPTLPGELTGFKLSRDGQTAIVNRNPHEIQVWSFVGVEPKLVRRLYGHTQAQYYVRACFAGPDDNIVLSGSEGASLRVPTTAWSLRADQPLGGTDSNVYVWHRPSGELLEVLRGHSEGAVNAVAWRPDVAGDEAALFASAGDDGAVYVDGISDSSMDTCNADAPLSLAASIFWDQIPPDQQLPERDLSGARQPHSYVQL